MKDRTLSPGVPRIRRARGFRIYDVEGRRYLDLHRDGALLGHRGAGVLTTMKSVLSQGLTTALPSAWEGRLVSVIKKAIPGWSEVRVFASRERALEAVGRFLGTAFSWSEVHDPALAVPPAPDARAALWRPLLPCPAASEVLMLQLPFTVCGAPMPVCFAREGDLPRSDAVPGFILAAAARGVAALMRPPSPDDPSRTRAVECAIDRSHAWRRQGPYVHAVFPAEDYPRVHAEFLRAGVLLCPGFPGPSVLPGECSPGESRLLADLFAGIPGG